jgi:hypothetical protein
MKESTHRLSGTRLGRGASQGSVPADNSMCFGMVWPLQLVRSNQHLLAYPAMFTYHPELEGDACMRAQECRLKPCDFTEFIDNCC